MKHGSEAYKVFKELLWFRKRYIDMFGVCMTSAADKYELKKENEQLKARNLKLEQALERRTMENVLGTHRLVNGEKDGTQYGEWASFIDGHSRSLEDALYRAVNQLLCHTMKYGMPDELDWVVKAEKDNPEAYGPLGYRPDMTRPDNDASVGWKAWYKKARPAGQ